MHFDLPADKLGSESASLTSLLNGSGEKRGYQLAMANAMWGQKGFPFSPQYVRHVVARFWRGVENTRFRGPRAARQEINKWVLDQTRGKIEDLIPQGGVTPSTRLVLTNASTSRPSGITSSRPRRTRPGRSRRAGKI